MFSQSANTQIQRAGQNSIGLLTLIAETSPTKPEVVQTRRSCHLGIKCQQLTYYKIEQHVRITYETKFSRPILKQESKMTTTKPVQHTGCNYMPACLTLGNETKAIIYHVLMIGQHVRITFDPKPSISVPKMNMAANQPEI